MATGRLWGRGDQSLFEIAPTWRRWLILGGRGAGKTRSGAEWVNAKVAGQTWTGETCGRIALVGGTLDEARAVMVEGVSGILSVHEQGPPPLFQPSRRRLTWANGAVAQLFSGEDPDSLRGPQFDAAWCDELAKWRYPEETWHMFYIGIGGYVGGRSIEKIAATVTASQGAGTVKRR